jgi:hypothetical protein
MTSILKVDTIQDTAGNNIINESSDTITIGASGDTITIPSGATLSSTDPLVFPAGTASLPAITTTGDTNTGIFFPTANTIGFAQNGTERIRFCNNGGIALGSGTVANDVANGLLFVEDGVCYGLLNGDNRIKNSSFGSGSATLYIGNAAIQVSSDQRLKTNIVNTTMSAIDKIKQVRIVDFNWNDPSDSSYNNRNARGTWTGVLAQELINVFPFAVNAPRKEEDLSIDVDSEKKWQVDQAHLVPVLMKAIQEQQTIIEELKARITTLENN